MRTGRAVRRPVPFSFLHGVLVVLVTAGCGTAAVPPPELRALWSDYAALPEERALAIAGQLRRNQWVAGASGGHATRLEAERAALVECQRRRAARGIVDPCRLYRGDEPPSATRGR